MILRHFYHYGSIFFVISAITKVSQFVNISHKSLVRYLYTNRPLDYLFIQFSCLLLNALFSKALFVVWYYNLYDDLVFIVDLFGFQFTSLDQQSYRKSIYSWIACTAFIHMSSINSTELPKTQFSWIKHFLGLISRIQILHWGDILVKYTPPHSFISRVHSFLFHPYGFTTKLDVIDFNGEYE